MQIIFIISIAAIPIVLLGLYFYSKNPRKQPWSEIAKIFALGIFSVLPVILFDLYLLSPITDALNDLLKIDNSFALAGLLRLALVTFFIILFVAIFSLVQSTALTLLYQLPWWQNVRTVSKKVYHLTPLLLVFLILFLIEIAAGVGWHSDFLLSVAGETVVFAVLEEYFKYLISPFLVYKKLNSIGSAMVNAAYVGLAFAFVENILFFVSASTGPNFAIIYTFRSLFTALLHVCASGLLGYFYGSSLFSKAIVTGYEIEKAEYNTLSWLTKWIGVRKKSIFKNLSVTQGFFIAAMVHAIYNLLISLGFEVIAALLALGLCVLIVYLLNLRATQIQYGIIGSAAMPEEDFEKLRLQLSVLQYAKEIAKEHEKREKV